MRPKKVRKSISLFSIKSFAIAGVLAIPLCILGISKGMKQEAQAARLEKGEPITQSVLLPVPSRAIAAGESLEGIPFKNVAWPNSSSIHSYASSQEELHGKYSLFELAAGVPVPLSSLGQGLREKNRVAESIPAGMRAITVKADAESAVEGWAQSGSFVDVILIRSQSNGEGSAKESVLESSVIAENVRILSAGSSTTPLSSADTTTKAPATVTLLTSQEDALKIKTAASLGRLTFALRGIHDSAPVEAKRVTQKHLGEETVQVITKPNYRGKATAPNGQQYVLDEASIWIRASSEALRVSEAVEINNNEKNNNEKKEFK
jgi:Flp pilus assembly protein CpaB